MIVLIEGARPERLGDLVRALVRDYPDLEVHTDARRLAGAGKGSVVVLAPDADQADWLNIERPLVAHRELRLVLFSDARTSGVLARKAVDFFHWISHRIECPKGPWMPAVRTIRGALCARAAGIAWKGGDLASAFEAALPGRPLSIVSAALSYDQLVEAARPRRRTWIGFTDVDGPFRLRRVRWAVAEAGRRGRVVLVTPTLPTPGFWPAQGTPLSIARGVDALEKAGAAHPGRLAALTDLEPEAVELAAELLRSSVSEESIEQALRDAVDPGVAVGRLALDREPSMTAESSPIIRALGSGHRQTDAPTAERGDAVEHMLKDVAQVPTSWGQLAIEAIGAEEPEIAVRWARRGLATGANRVAALGSLGAALFIRGELTEAENVLREAWALHEGTPGVESRTHTALLRNLARVLTSRGDHHEAEKLLRSALASSQNLEAEHDSVKLLSELSSVLALQGEYEQAERLLEQAMAIQAKSGVENQELSRDFAELLTHQGKHSEAETLLRRVLRLQEVTPGIEHTSYSRSQISLAKVLLEQGKHREAERILRASLAMNEKLGRIGLTHSRVLHELGRALLEQGNYAAAEDSLRKALAAKERVLGKNNVSYASSLQELGRVLVRQGKVNEAEPFFRQSAAIKKGRFGDDHIIYAKSLYELAQALVYGEKYAEAETVWRQVLSIEEGVLGHEHPDLVDTLDYLADAVALQGRAVEAERILRRALRIAETAHDEQRAAPVLSALAQTQDAMGRRDAADTARRALDALSRVLGEDHPFTQEDAPLLEAILEKNARRP